MGHVAVSALGADRPGIVAAVTQVLYENGANLEDTSMSILRGHFSMMLVVAVPDGTRAADLEAALAPVADRLELVMAARDIDDDVPLSPEGESWTAVVYGADQPGIVHRITHALAGLRVNITDLTTRVIGDESQPTYAMVVDLTLPPGADGAAVERRLQELGADLEVDISLHPSEADIL